MFERLELEPFARSPHNIFASCEFRVALRDETEDLELSLRVQLTGQGLWIRPAPKRRCLGPTSVAR